MNQDQQSSIHDVEPVWRTVAVSVQGTSHVRQGIPCQDAWAWQVLPGGVLAAAIADGAGSAALSQIGSELAVRVTLEFLQGLSQNGAPPFWNEDSWRVWGETLFRSVRDPLEAEAETRGVPVRDLATTLIVICAGVDFVAVAQVGDGAVIVRTEDDSLHALTRPAPAEYANETVFVTLPNAAETAQYVYRPGAITHLAAFTDGLQRLALKMPEADPFAPFFAPLFRFVEETPDPEDRRTQLEAFLRSPRVADRTDDDLTLLLCTSPSL